MTNIIIKAISLWQPWASLWVSPNKLHETRHWSTPYRGQLLVHAAKKIVFDLDEELADIVVSEFGGHWGMDLPTGAIVGVVDLTDVIPTEKLYMKGFMDDADMACGDFSAGRFGWRRGSYRRFREPIPYRGHQRIFNVQRSVVAAVIESAELRH
ncbi:ASCH domain-containing protein [Bradyrhizobium sp. Pa8]|uniref:ASCH domain-containing protein n=1 Tax=Bradyrhizobium sp. Pa8 TaxID=3386552 RepID=UPI00403F1680